MASNSTNKRQRTAADALHISDLPIGFIADVSSYLSKPSRALLAVAFSAPSSSWQNNNLMHQQSPILQPSYQHNNGIHWILKILIKNLQIS